MKKVINPILKLVMCGSFSLLPIVTTGCTKDPGPGMMLGAALLVGGSITAVTLSQKKQQPRPEASAQPVASSPQDPVSNTLNAIFGTNSEKKKK